ncbi:metal ABC transporter permease [Arsenophonus endosymbiont of Aleurodicus floccissimus]|uniref:metal ABC transporter permease n=1 Tax=Arsenophonus endosymbiont of Aleurodicus floccissimus TaxID=2152761 RepID=UPI0034E2954F
MTRYRYRLFVIGILLSIGAFISGIFCAFATGYLKENSRIKEDTVMGIIFSGMFAFGLVLFARIDTDQHLTHILFGNILGITKAEFKQTLWISAFTITIILLKRKDFMLYCFDPNQAKVISLPVKLLHHGLLSLLALTIVASLSGRNNSGHCYAYFPWNYSFYTLSKFQSNVSYCGYCLNHILFNRHYFKFSY